MIGEKTKESLNYLSSVVSDLINNNDEEFVLIMLNTIECQLNTLNCQLDASNENVTLLNVSDEFKNRLGILVTILQKAEEEVIWLQAELQKMELNEN